jgi:hypothetical protein
MVFVALISWIVTVSAGLYLLAIWLIEYDISAPGGAVTRLPRTVISGHGLLASLGLLAWIGYLVAAPAESHFPVPVVVANGVLAFSTITLVLLTVLGVGGS